MKLPLFSGLKETRRFRSRIHAAELLYNLLPKLQNDSVVVLAASSSALPMAKYLAGKLNTRFDLALVQAVGEPTKPEVTLGYVTEDGKFHQTATPETSNFSETALQAFAHGSIEKLKRLRKLFTPGRASLDPSERNVIVVDDGDTTETELVSLIRSLSSRNAKKIVVASTVASCDTVQKILGEGTEIICLKIPLKLESASEYYESFSRPSPLDVIEILNRSARA